MRYRFCEVRLTEVAHAGLKEDDHGRLTEGAHTSLKDSNDHTGPSEGDHTGPLEGDHTGPLRSTWGIYRGPSEGPRREGYTCMHGRRVHVLIMINTHPICRIHHHPFHHLYHLYVCLTTSDQTPYHTHM